MQKIVRRLLPQTRAAEETPAATAASAAQATTAAPDQETGLSHNQGRPPEQDSPAPLSRSQRRRRRQKKAAADNPAQEATPAPADLPRDHWFGNIQVSQPVAQALQDMGYTDPTPIQEQAIPAFLDGSDVVGQAMTGTGKTAAFGIPLAEMIDPQGPYIQAVVLTPTRELAVQVTGELSRLSANRGLRVVSIYGGQPINTQINALKKGAHIVVGTPGRIMDHMGRGTLHLDQVRFAILDEADEMLDIGFADDMEFILRRTPRQRQTALFSATFPGFIRGLIHRHLHEPVTVRIGGEIETVDEVEQVYYEVSERNAPLGLREILDQQVNGGQALIFCRTQVQVDRLVGYLSRCEYPVYGLHGGKRQTERNSAMQNFRDGSLRILVSTNLASRGIDIPTITHVINYDMPENVEEYVHRIGRAGRMGRTGTAVTLVTEWDFEMLDAITQHVGDRLKQGSLSVSP